MLSISCHKLFIMLYNTAVNHNIIGFPNFLFVAFSNQNAVRVLTQVRLYPSLRTISPRQKNYCCIQ